MCACACACGGVRVCVPNHRAWRWSVVTAMGSVMGSRTNLLIDCPTLKSPRGTSSCPPLLSAVCGAYAVTYSRDGVRETGRNATRRQTPARACHRGQARKKTYLKVLTFVGHDESKVLLVDHVLGGEDADATHVLGEQSQLTRAVLPPEEEDALVDVAAQHKVLECLDRHDVVRGVVERHRLGRATIKVEDPNLCHVHHTHARAQASCQPRLQS
jgi:hypothetical protein